MTVGANNDTSDTASVGTLSNAGTITVDTGASLTLSSGASDSNTRNHPRRERHARYQKSHHAQREKGALTLTGGTITGVGAGVTLNNTSTIQGSGAISELCHHQHRHHQGGRGAITMQIGITSAGDGAQLNKFSGTTLTGGIYNLHWHSAIRRQRHDPPASNAANITLNGAGRMIDFGNNNILAGFNNNASTGIFKLASGAALSTTGGSFTNAGAFTVSAGTTFTVGGSGFNFTQTGGATTVDGTLTSATPGTLAVNGGSLDGAGTLGYNVVDDSTLTPGDSAAKTGKLEPYRTPIRNNPAAHWTSRSTAPPPAPSTISSR